jgi:dipeptidyl aminopeptidase/acylaminoacyl peptidase
MLNVSDYFRKAALAALLIIGLGAAARSQTPSPSPTATPGFSDIFIVDIKNERGGMRFGQPVKITTFAGYNNQPSFLPDGRSVLYTSIRDKQADIYRYDLRSGATSQVTHTPESEYSPTLMPDGRNISVVRVEADGTQRLWKFPLAGGQPSLILEHIKPVGYHLWIDDHTLALFILGAKGQPNTLQIVDVPTEKAEVVAENPGRILRRIPHQNKFSFVHKISDREWTIKEFDLRTHTSASLTATLPGVEDYAWLPSGTLLMAKDSKVFSLVPLRGKTWEEIEDFSKTGLKGITRIAVSPKGDRIAIIARTDDRR